MSNGVDLRQLAIDRGDAARPRVCTRRHVLTRYVLPGALMLGFLSLVVWASWDLVFPPRRVTVVPVFSTRAEVQRQGTPLFKAAGWIEPRPTPVGVAALAPGVVERLLVVENQQVKAGEPVAELVKDDARLVCDRATADLKLRKAELEEATAARKAAVTRLEQPVHLQAALGEAEASLAKIQTQLKKLPFDVRQAEATRDAAQKQYDGQLAAKGVVAGVEIDRARGALESAKALVEGLVEQRESLEKEQTALIQRRDALGKQLGLLADEIKAKDEAEARIKAAMARVEQAEVALAEAKLRLERMTVRAPIDGRIYDLVGHPGAHVGGGEREMHGHDGSTVVTMYCPDRLQVRADVRFEDLPNVTLRQPVRIENPALAAPLTGHVLFVSSEADIQKNTLQVKVAIPSPPPVFKPEMLVDVTFLAPEQPERASEPSQELRLYVPQQLIHQGDAGPFVWTADQSRRVARKTSVETRAVGSNGLVEIAGGLTVSSRIIVGGSDGLEDGARITVTGEDPSLGPEKATAERSAASGTPSQLPTGDNP
jgi:RND family efflux transporter MFP subunit